MTHIRPEGLLVVATLLVSPTALAAQRLKYPPAPQADVVDEYFGRRAADPYRPLEDLDTPATKAWLHAEHALTVDYLAALPSRDSIRQRLTVLWDYPRVQVPVHEAGHLWFRKNSGLQKQSVLYREAAAGGEPAVVLDPNVLSPDGSTAVSQWSASPDGRTLAYTTAVGGSDLQDIHLRNLAVGRDLPDVVVRVKFSDLSWTRDGKGFYYSRFRGSAEGANLREANTHHQLLYHRLGGGQDRVVFERPDDSTAWVNGDVSDDGRWLFVSSGSGTTNNRLWLANLNAPSRPDLRAPLAPVVVAEDAINSPLGVVGDTLYLYTNWQAPRGRIVGAAVRDSTRAHWRTIVPEGPNVMSGALLVGHRLVVSYLADVQSEVRLFDLTGAPRGKVPLPDVGTADGLTGRTDGSDFFFSFESYLRPAAVYRYDLRTRHLEPFHPAKTAFDPTPYETRATFYRSKDGTRVPIFVTACRGLIRRRPGATGIAPPTA